MVQDQVKTGSSETQNEISSARRKLDRDIETWFSTWYEPVLEPILRPIQDQFPEELWPERAGSEPETLVLPIPSSWPTIVRTQPSNSLSRFIKIEHRLRCGEANDILHDVRNKIGLYSFIWKKTSGSFGQASKTRNEKTITNTRSKIETLRIQYEATRKKLRLLGEPLDSHNYRPLTQQDCTPMNVEHSQEELGTKNKITSWIWRDNSYHHDPSSWQREGKFQFFTVSRMLR